MNRLRRRLQYILVLSLLVTGVATEGCRAFFQPKHNVILVVVDALRPDRLSCYGYRRHTTPNFDELAARGAVWRNAFAPMPMTQPSFVSMYTSLQPFSHGITFNDVAALSPAAVTLAETLRENGWQTAAMVGAANLDSVFGLNQGYEFYEENMQLSHAGKSIGNIARWERKAEDVNQAAFQWLDRRDRSRSFFLMIHYFDTHDPYSPPDPFQPAINSSSDLYDGEVRYVDHQFGELMDRLEKDGLISNTLILLTADHGEAFGEHKVAGHKWMVYDEFLRVPLIAAGPGIDSGVKHDALVQHIDLAPTILSYLRLKIPAFYQGRSLLSGSKGVHDFVMLQKATPSQRAYKTKPGWRKFPHEQWAVRTKNEKLIWSTNDEFEYYDLKSDPGEHQNLYESRTARAMELYRLGAEHRSRTPRINLVWHPARDGDTEAEEALRALGYLD